MGLTPGPVPVTGIVENCSHLEATRALGLKVSPGRCRGVGAEEEFGYSRGGKKWRLLETSVWLHLPGAAENQNATDWCSGRTSAVWPGKLNASCLHTGGWV